MLSLHSILELIHTIFIAESLRHGDLEIPSTIAFYCEDYAIIKQTYAPTEGQNSFMIVFTKWDPLSERRGPEFLR